MPPDDQYFYKLTASSILSFVGYQVVRALPLSTIFPIPGLIIAAITSTVIYKALDQIKSEYDGIHNMSQRAKAYNQGTEFKAIILKFADQYIEQTTSEDQKVDLKYRTGNNFEFYNKLIGKQFTTALSTNYGRLIKDLVEEDSREAAKTALYIICEKATERTSKVDHLRVY